MRFMMLYKPGYETDEPPTPETMAAVGALIEDMARSGVLIATDGLRPSSNGVRVRVDGGDFVVTDGPFTETKELVAGYAIVRARSKEHAIELAKRFLAIMGEGESEIRLMEDAAAPPGERGNGRGRAVAERVATSEGVGR